MYSNAVSPPLPWRRDLHVIETGLRAWAGTRRAGAGAGAVTNVRAPDGGMANDTVLFELDGETLVARLAPAPGSPYPTFPTFDLGFQRRAIELVRTRTDVPVPEVVHLEEAEDWLGAPFMVTRAVEGTVASDSPPYLVDPDGWFLRGTPDQWRRFETSTIDVLVRLHRVVVDDADTAFLRWDGPGDTQLERQLGAHRAYYEWAREGHTIPIIERAFDVVTATMPANDRSVLNWGDAKPANIIYRDFEPVAVLDWEMAGAGPPEVDVGWLTFFQKFFAFMAAQQDMKVPDIFGTAATVAAYERRSSDRLGDMAWYEALAGLRLGIIVMRMSLRGAAFGVYDTPRDPDDLVVFAPLLEALLDAV